LLFLSPPSGNFHATCPFPLIIVAFLFVHSRVPSSGTCHILSSAGTTPVPMPRSNVNCNGMKKRSPRLPRSKFAAWGRDHASGPRLLLHLASPYLAEQRYIPRPMKQKLSRDILHRALLSIPPAIGIAISALPPPI